MSDPPPSRGEPPPPAGGTSFLSRAKAVFLAVRTLRSPQREEELARQCGEDARLRALVESLLEGERSPMPFATLAEDIVAAQDALAHRSQSALAEESAGTLIGPYRVIEKIGEGGFGVVYLAEQEEPIRRRVALKILKVGMDTRQIVARFEAERQALAIMDHPVIARVFDGGATRSGRPYFVMELVRGEPITEYCDRRSLPVEARLELFRVVCEGVQHAHQKGVIHRDLKPANILVGEVDGRPAPRIIDFGIAKAISRPLTEKTYFTEFRQLIGTPEYMSPEQSEPGVSRDGDADIDTRADVYSLGVVLYELLAGATPLDGERLRSAAYGEMQRIIREDEPPRPSTRLKALPTRAIIASRRSTDPARLDATLLGELDWVVMKCLDKDRNRRYGSAAELSQDLERHLDHRPVIARPPSRAYVVRKFVRRHRVMVGLTLAIAVLLVAGAGGTAAGLVSATRANRQLDQALVEVRSQRDLAQANARKAQTQLQRSIQLTEFLRSMLRSASPQFGRDRDTTVLRELLDAAVARIEQGELRSEPIVEAELRAAIADTFKVIGDNKAALRVIEPALALAEAAPQDDQPAFQNTRLAAAGLLSEWQRNGEARLQLDRFMGVRARTGAPEDEPLAKALTNYGILEVREGRFEDALKSLEHALAIRRRLDGERSPNVAGTLGNIAGALTQLGRLDESLAAYREAIAIYEAMNPQPLLHLAIIKNNAASLLLDMNRPGEAEPIARESLELCSRIFKPEHQQTGMSLHTLGSTLSRLGRHEEAAQAFTRAADVLAAAFNARHPFVRHCRLSLAEELRVLGRFGECEKNLLGILDHASSGASPDPTVREALAALYDAWEQAEPGQGHQAQAAKWRAPPAAPSATPPEPGR